MAKAIAIFLAAFTLSGFSLAGEANDSPASRADSLRRPVAAVLLNEGRTLCVANRCGSISLVDTESLQVRREVPVAKRLSHMAALPHESGLLALDDEQDQLLLLEVAKGRWQVAHRIPVPAAPVDAIVSPDGGTAFVASLWPRKLSVVRLARADETSPLSPTITKTIPLPCSPGELLLLPKHKRLLASDAFGGKLVVVETETLRVEQTRRLDAHNIRGLTLDEKRRRVYFAHQKLETRAPITAENIRSGRLIENVLRAVRVDSLLEGGDVWDASLTFGLDRPWDGAGDPRGVGLLPGGWVVIALSGVQQAAILKPDTFEVRRLDVQQRPQAIVIDPRTRRAYVLNTLSDSISVIDTQKPEVIGTISLGQPRLTSRDRGERLFYDARLSVDAWMSCHSCHTGGHTSGLLADTAGDGSYGAPKRIPSLLGTSLTDTWAWNGKVKNLHDQLHKSVGSTLHGLHLTAQQARDLAAFLHDLPFPPPAEPVPDTPADRAKVSRGRKVFERHECSRCHVPPLTYTTQGAFDVGLQDERGNRKFNPPSLRGVGHRSQFFHDGRAKELEEVFTFFGHGLQGDLSKEELTDLLRFLRSL